jgi:hypothetical protein
MQNHIRRSTPQSGEEMIPMNWSFVIIYLDTNYLDTMIRSIVNQEEMGKDKCQIVLVGDESQDIFNKINYWKKRNTDITFVYHDEKIKPYWITRKKNIGIQASKYENLCITHDYIGFCKGWYKGFIEFGSDWDVCMNPIRFSDNKRFRDWISFKEYWGSPEFVSYNDNSKTQKMYISGTYWCAKKTFMLKNPMNEQLSWGQGEDLEWSHRCRNTWNYKLNINSPVKILKEKLWKGKLDYCPHPNTDPDLELTRLSAFELQK